METTAPRCMPPRPPGPTIGPEIMATYRPVPPSATFIAAASTMILRVSLVVVSTGSCAFTSNSPTGRSVRVCQSISWLSGSAAIPPTNCRIV